MSFVGFKIGELARRSGVSVRTLHHYHELRLLVPSHHSPGEARIYTTRDVERLQSIRSLKALGLSLAEIGAELERPGVSTLEIVERHLERVERELEQGRRLRARLEHVATRLRAAEEVSADDLLATIQETVVFEKYYTPEQLEQLRVRGTEVGAERMAQVQAEWLAVFDGFAAAQAEGLAPDHERCLELARKSRDLIAEFTGGDAGIERSLATLYASEGSGRVLEGRGMDVAPGVFELMQRARAAL